MNYLGDGRTALYRQFALILVVLSLAAYGNSGDYGNSSTTPISGSKLFAADSGNFAIGSLIDSNPMPGTITVDRIITGSNTGLASLF